MKIAKTAPQHLSNYEVLQHFLNLKKDNDILVAAATNHGNREIVRAREHLPLSKRERQRDPPELPEVRELSPAAMDREDREARRGVSDDLVWVQDEVLKYLCADYNITARQTPDGVSGLTDQLQDYGLTKAELLQVCNLAPRSQVGLYLIIEEAEKRLGQPYEETMNTLVQEVIAPTLLPEVPEDLLPYVNTVQATDIAQTIMDDAAEYADEETYGDEEEFVHEAEWGPGREGGVDDDEDNAMD